MVSLIKQALTVLLPITVQLVSCQIFVGSNSSQSQSSIAVPAPAGLSASCNATFNNSVTCDTNLPSIAYGAYFATNDDLNSICTSDCLQSLETFRTKQVSACSSGVAIVNGQNYPPTFNIDYLLWTYNYTCRKDKASGAWCAPIFDTWGSSNSTNGPAGCSDCVLGTLQYQLDSPFGYEADQVQSLSSLTSSCKATGYAVTSPPPYTASGPTSSNSTATSTSTSAIPSCSSQYTVKSGDDCHSISKSQRVSTAAMLYLNGLEGHCTNFPGPGKQLCMPHSCDVYTVVAHDTCYGIAQTTNGSATVAQLTSWNIDINRNCDNLDQLIGDQICISYPGDVANQTSNATPSSLSIAPVPSNALPGTNTRCGKWYTVVRDDNCASVTQNLGISLSDFYFLNPEINSTTCINLQLGNSYCVQAVGDIKTYPGYGGALNDPCVGNTKSGSSSCYATTYSTGSYWDLPTIAANATAGGNSSSFTSFTIKPVPLTITSQTRSINPTPSPTQTGMVSNCGRFYNVRPGDECGKIATKYSIPLATLYAWNTALGTDCHGLQASVWICVATGTTSSTGTPTASANAKVATSTSASSKSSSTKSNTKSSSKAARSVATEAAMRDDSFFGGWKFR